MPDHLDELLKKYAPNPTRVRVSKATCELVKEPKQPRIVQGTWSLWGHLLADEHPMHVEKSQEGASVTTPPKRVFGIQVKEQDRYEGWLPEEPCQP